MDFNTILDIIVLLIFLYGMTKKIMGYTNLMQYKKEGAQVYRFQSVKLRFIQYLCLTISLVLLGLYIYGISIGKLTFNLTTINPILFFFYFGFLPTSGGYWALTRKGIYLYMYDRYIKWPELIQIGWVQKKEKDVNSPYYLTLIVKKRKGEFLKQTNFRCIVPAEDKKVVEEFVNGERKKVDHIMLRKKSTPYMDEIRGKKKRF